MITRILNWSIGIYVVARWFLHDYSSHLLYPIYETAIPCFILFAVVFLSLYHWLQCKDLDLPAYRRFCTGDYLRMFFVLCIIDRPLGDSRYGFWLISIIAIPSFAILIYVFIREFTADKSSKSDSSSALTVGSAFFAYFLANSWLMLLTLHFGVSAIGHFLEPPRYTASYVAQVESDSPPFKAQAVADIRVENRVESEYGEDHYGNVKTHSYDVRDIWILRLHLPGGVIIDVDDQDESISDFGLDASVTDSTGAEWRVSLQDSLVQ